MGQESLVESDISDSIALIKVLDDQGDGPTSAFWHYFADADEWRLVLAGPIFDDLLPKEEARAYQKIAEALIRSHATSLTIGAIKLVRTDQPLVETTRFVIRTPPTDVTRAHFVDTTVNGVFIKDMLVLRSS